MSKWLLIRPEGCGWITSVRGVGAATLSDVQYDTAYDNSRMHRNIPVEHITIIVYGVEFDQPRAGCIMEVVEEEEVEEADEAEQAKKEAEKAEDLKDTKEAKKAKEAKWVEETQGKHRKRRTRRRKRKNLSSPARGGGEEGSIGSGRGIGWSDKQK